MHPANSALHQKRERYRQASSPSGVFASYCKARLKFLPHRLLTIFSFALIIGLFGGAALAAKCMFPVIAVDGLEALVLKRCRVRRVPEERLSIAIGFAAMLGGLQALTICVATAYMATEIGPSAYTLAAIIILVVCLDALALMYLNRSAAIARLSMCAGVGLIAATHVLQLRSTGWESLALTGLGLTVMLTVGVYFNSLGSRLYRQQRALSLRLLDAAIDAEATAHALEENRLARRRLTLVAENANDGVVILDTEGTITWANEAMGKISDPGGTSPLGQNIQNLLTCGSEGAPSRVLRDALQHGRPARCECRLKGESDSKGWVEISLTPVLGEDSGDVSDLVAIVRDISHVKEREERLAEARRAAEANVEARHRFLATMSHEIRTPMTGVLGTTDLLLETDLDDHQRALLQTVSGSAEALLTIVDDVLDLSKLEAGKFTIVEEPFSLARCVSDVVNLLRPMAEAKGLRLVSALPRGMPDTVLGDNGRIRQILLNLVGNAIKFTPQGFVTVRVDAEQTGRSLRCLVRVEDTGIGMTAAEFDRVFDPYAQANSGTSVQSGGTGLGLSISRMLAERMGGTLTGVSEVGRGTAFTFDLVLRVSVEQLQPDVPGPPAISDELVLAGYKILVAEDNRTNTLLIDRMLGPAGAELVFAVNGREAVSFFKEHAPDIVLMDINLPLLDGTEAIRQIRAFESTDQTVPIPILALTAKGFPEDRVEIMAAGADDVIIKPFRKRPLLSAISSALNKSDLRSSVA